MLSINDYERELESQNVHKPYCNDMKLIIVQHFVVLTVQLYTYSWKIIIRRYTIVNNSILSTKIHTHMDQLDGSNSLT